MFSPQSTSRQVICIDMDEVIADTLTEHLFRYNRDFQANLSRADLCGRLLRDLVPPEHQASLEEYTFSEDFFSSLAVLPNAQRVLLQLQSRYDIFIATAAMEIPSSFNAKFRWLSDHFPFSPASHIVFCGDKSILRGDFLIDDNPRQLSRFHGGGILFSSPTNTFVTGFQRVDTWLDVEAFFLS